MVFRSFYFRFMHGRPGPRQKLLIDLPFQFFSNPDQRFCNLFSQRFCNLFSELVPVRPPKRPMVGILAEAKFRLLIHGTLPVSQND